MKNLWIKKHQQKKNNIDRLNFYRDQKIASQHIMTTSEQNKKRLTDPKTFSKSERVALRLVGTKALEKTLNSRYETAKRLNDHSTKKVDELIKKLKNVELKEIPSYRQVTYGNTTTSWMGSEYIKSRN